MCSVCERALYGWRRRDHARYTRKDGIEQSLHGTRVENEKWEGGTRMEKSLRWWRSEFPPPVPLGMPQTWNYSGLTFEHIQCGHLDVCCTVGKGQVVRKRARERERERKARWNEGLGLELEIACMVLIIRGTSKLHVSAQLKQSHMQTNRWMPQFYKMPRELLIIKVTFCYMPTWSFYRDRVMLDHVTQHPHAHYHNIFPLLADWGQFI